MKVYHETLTLQSQGYQVSYHEITKQVKEVLNKSEIKNGIVVVQSPHTTCSVIFEEYVHDTDYRGNEFLQVDLNRILDRVIPRQLTENQDYRYPGPEHYEFLMGMNDPNYPPDPALILNGDAHIRASFFGASETFVVENGDLAIGTVGYIYFVDFDQNRPRERKCKVLIMGTWHGYKNKY